MILPGLARQPLGFGDLLGRHLAGDNVSASGERLRLGSTFPGRG